VSEPTEPISEADARRTMHTEGDDVVRPWEERLEVMEAAADDTTAPPPDESPPTVTR
jgi:hypothetical protein